MRRYLVLVVPIFLFCFIGCSEEKVSSPAPPADDPAVSPELEAIAWDLIEKAQWPVVASGDELEAHGLAQGHGPHGGPHHPLFGFERTRIQGNIYHYFVEVPVGPGEHERIGLHRVVKERRPFRPIHTDKTLFGLHGTPGHFEVMYLAGTVSDEVPDDQSLAVYLAEHNIDVWGIDQAYTLLPDGITDFSFMDGWDMAFDAQNLRTAMAVARLVRLITGSGFGKMNLMGYSTGLAVGFAAVNMEAPLPNWQRQIGGFIPVDYFMKTDDPPNIESGCEYAAIMDSTLAAGGFATNVGEVFQTIGYLADNDPEGDSPVIPGFTNLQTALFAAAQTSEFAGFPGEAHFFAGIFDDETGLPIDLRYTDVQHYLDWLQAFNYYNSNFVEYDIAVLHCDEEDSPHDDYLGLIEIPVFFLGANGGWGHLMDYTASLLVSCDDIEILNVSLLPEQDEDIGHVDIYTAGNAEIEFWSPVLEWIEDHAD